MSLTWFIRVFKLVFIFENFKVLSAIVLLIDVFNVTVNELLAGKRIETENLNEIVEENVIRVIESKEKAVKKKKAQMIICSVLFLVLLLPPAVPTFVYIYDMILSNISFENITEFIGFLTVSAIIFAEKKEKESKDSKNKAKKDDKKTDGNKKQKNT